MPPPQAPTLVAQPEAMLLVAEPPVSAAHQCVLETEATERNLGHGITIPEERWETSDGPAEGFPFCKGSCKGDMGCPQPLQQKYNGHPMSPFPSQGGRSSERGEAGTDPKEVGCPKE
ncbi:hypothetical protein MRX96_019307 [Rhipicephalus microplus]